MAKKEGRTLSSRLLSTALPMARPPHRTPTLRSAPSRRRMQEMYGRFAVWRKQTTDADDDLEAKLRDLEYEKERFKLTKEEFALFREKVFLALSVVTPVGTIASWGLGAHWPIPVGGLTATAASWAATLFEGRRVERLQAADAERQD